METELEYTKKGNLLTNTPSTTPPTDPNDDPEKLFPGIWEPVKERLGFESRQLTEDTFQIRSKSHEITVTKKGYELFKTDSPEWQMWLFNNGITSTPRSDWKFTWPS